MKNFLISLASLLFVFTVNCANGMPVAKVGLIITVVDETGSSVPDVFVRGGGWIQGEPGATGVRRATDEKGIVAIDVRTATDVGFLFNKDGYYGSRMHYSVADGGAIIEDGYWQPNPIKETVVLKRIRNPVPMYVKAVNEKVPVYGQAVGYDLMAGDWVAPYGKGSVADFIFNVTGEYKSFHERETRMAVTFSNAKDGIQSFKSLPLHNEEPLGSVFWSGYEAPINGYESVYEYERISTQDGSRDKNVFQRKDLNYYYRVRAQVDSSGNVEKAMYGKIYRDFFCYYDHFKNEIKVQFWYYLNPDGTRNMEADTKKNLFGPTVNVGITP